MSKNHKRKFQNSSNPSTKVLFSQWERFVQSVERLSKNEELIIVTNIFHAWGNEEGYFADYDPNSPDRDDGFLVEDYLRPVIRLMRLFKDGDIDMPLTLHYEVHEGELHAITYGGSYKSTFGERQYSLEEEEVSEVQDILDTTHVPFKRGFVGLAFDFFELSQTIRHSALQFLLLMISLEVLFNPGDRAGVSRSVSLNISKLLGNDSTQKQIYSEVRQLYEKRSRLVHEGIHDYSSYLHNIAPDFDRNQDIHGRRVEHDKPSFINPEDLIRLRDFVRSSIMHIMRNDESKDNFLKRLSKNL